MAKLARHGDVFLADERAWCGSLFTSQGSGRLFGVAQREKESRISQTWVRVSSLPAPSFISCIAVGKIMCQILCLSVEDARQDASWVLKSNSGP